MFASSDYFKKTVPAEYSVLFELSFSVGSSFVTFTALQKSLFQSDDKATTIRRQVGGSFTEKGWELRTRIQTSFAVCIAA